MARKRLPPEVREYFAKMGKIGGQKGLAARMEKVSPERRREIAQKAIAARWAKRIQGEDSVVSESARRASGPGRP